MQKPPTEFGGYLRLEGRRFLAEGTNARAYFFFDLTAFVAPLDATFLGAAAFFAAFATAFFAGALGAAALFGALARVAATADFSSALSSATLMVVADLRRR
jgi:hypothetical protein